MEFCLNNAAAQPHTFAVTVSANNAAAAPLDGYYAWTYGTANAAGNNGVTGTVKCMCTSCRCAK